MADSSAGWGNFPGVVLALSTGQELGLLAMAAVFIAFALASAFLFPRARPDFPGKQGVRWFSILSLVLMVAMLAAVFALAREPEESEARGEGGTSGETQMPGQTQTEPSGEGGQGSGGAPTIGDAGAGKTVFASAGCGGCHTLANAGSSGEVGPSLDEAKSPYELVVDRVTNGRGAMPSFADQLDEEEIQNVAAYVAQAAGG